MYPEVFSDQILPLSIKGWPPLVVSKLNLSPNIDFKYNLGSKLDTVLAVNTNPKSLHLIMTHPSLY
jgi:hypothetical protein